MFFATRITASCILIAAALLLSSAVSASPSPIVSGRAASGAPLPKLPLCVPPELTSPLTGKYPKSAVTTVQTGKNCNKYGDPPAKILSPLESPDGLQEAIQICHGKIVTMSDNTGNRRTACFYANPASTSEKPLPLLVWLNPSIVSATFAFPLTGIDAVRQTQSLNNEDPSRLGFSYILPFGRNTVHQYPFPDNVGLGMYASVQSLEPDC